MPLAIPSQFALLAGRRLTSVRLSTGRERAGDLISYLHAIKISMTYAHFVHEISKLEIPNLVLSSNAFIHVVIVQLKDN